MLIDNQVKIQNIPFNLDEQAFIELVDRVTNGKYGKYIKINKIFSQSGFDEYSISSDGKNICISATSGVSACVAFNVYLRKYCKYYYGILTQSDNLPPVPPETDGTISNESVFHYRYAFNYCTFGYSYAFNDWNDWEKITDYLLLSGYNLVLNPIGNECVWLELLMKFGYTREESKKYLSAPNYLPWQWMMNISAYFSDYPDYWFDEQREISRKFNSKLDKFGAGVVLPGYCGAVPDDFNLKFPEEKILSQGDWVGFTRPAMLSHKSKLFNKISSEYYAIQKSILNADNAHYYSTDPFHEGGCREGIDLKDYALTVLKQMKNADDKAVWFLQGWQGNPDREMLSALPEKDVLICNLQGDSFPDGTDNFLGYPYIYCVVNNFGGQQILRGSAERTWKIPYEMVKKDDNSCCGIGVMPEGVECDEFLFDVIGDVSVKNNISSFDEFIRLFTISRYGTYDIDFVDAYKILSNTVYVNDIWANKFESSLCARPSLTVDRVSTWGGSAEICDNSNLINVISLLKKHYEELKDNQGYIADLVGVTRQLVANEGWKYVYGLNNAFKNKQKNEFEFNSEKLLKLFDLQMEVVDCDKNLNLQLQIERATKRGHTEKDKKWFREMTLSLFTIWGDKGASVGLHDYAAREYGDMLRYFYKPRWIKYIDKLRECLNSNREFTDYDRFEDEKQFMTDYKKGNREISRNLLSVVNKVIDFLN